MMDGSGALRPEWNRLVNALAEMGEEFKSRWNLARRLFIEYDVMQRYGSGFDSERPWYFDPMPHLVAKTDWEVLEKGLIQRARMMEAVVRDLYGRQELLRKGIIPAGLVFGQQRFLRPLHGVSQVHAWLQVIAFDVGRNSDGSWLVVGDRMQTPTGLGFALENRNTTLRILPEAFQATRALRIASFYERIKERLSLLSPAGIGDPGIVLWSPGPSSPSWYEHLLLARQLGIPVVEDQDLTTRDNKVYMKTLAGLRPIGVIHRCTDDHLCDPLELASAGTHGIPGLIHCVRKENVAIANGLGSGVAGNPALVPFLSQIARHLIGEDLLLPSIATRWCGEPGVLARTGDSPESLIFKNVTHNGFGGSVRGSKLSPQERGDLLDRIGERPELYAVQEPVELSTTPMLRGGNSLKPTPVVMRLYLLSTPDGWEVMPGGLALTSEDWESNFVGLKAATATKDVWVVSEEEPEASHRIAPLFPPVILARATLDMPSRVVDNLYWLGRYAERTEGLLRILRVLLTRLLDETPLNEDDELDVLLRWMTKEALIPERLVSARSRNRLGELEYGLLDLIYGTDPGSLRSLAKNLRRTLRLVRDRISADAWRYLGRIEDELPAVGVVVPTGCSGALELLDQMLLPLAAFSGLAGESMTRGPGWRFLDMGRRVERAWTYAGLLREAFSETEQRDEPNLKLLLVAMESYMTYSVRYQTGVQPHAVLDLLLTDESNPRSVVWQLKSLASHVEQLLGPSFGPLRAPEHVQILRMYNSLALSNVLSLAQRDADGHRTRLDNLLGDLLDQIPEFSNTLAARYFTHSESLRQREESAAEPE